MRRDVRRHADGDADGAVDEQLRKARRQHGGLLVASVVVGDEVDRILFDIGHHVHRDLRELRLGITHRGGRVAVDGAEVALAVDERIAQGEVLRQADERVVDGRLAVGMEVFNDVARGGGGLRIVLVGGQAGVVHTVQDAPVHGLHAVAHIRQRAGNDDGHGIVDEGRLHLPLDVHRDNMLCVGGFHTVYSFRRRSVWTDAGLFLRYRDS